MKKLLLLLFAGAVSCAAQSVNPATQIKWPKATGSGSPGLVCTSANYGQPYTDTTNNVQWQCGSAGWFQSGIAGGSTPAPPAYCVQLANAGVTGFTCDSAVTVDTVNHILEVGGGITGNKFTLKNLSPIAADWTLDVTSAATARSTLGLGRFATQTPPDAASGTTECLQVDDAGSVTGTGSPCPSVGYTGASGYQQFGGGIVLQWAQGATQTTSGSTQVVSMPYASCTTVLSVMVGTVNENGGSPTDTAMSFYQEVSHTTTSVTVFMMRNADHAFNPAAPTVWMFCH